MLSRRDVGRPYFVPLSVTSRCWPQRCDVIFQHSQEHYDVGFQHSQEHCDVGFQHPDVGLKESLEHHDVGTSTFWNVATLDPNVVTLVLYSRERRDVGPERHDVSPVFMNIKCSFYYSSYFLGKP